MASTSHIVSSARVDLAAINEMIRLKCEPIWRKTVMFPMLKKRGNITNNHSGPMMEWRPRYRRRTLTTGGSPQNTTFEATNTHQKAELPWRTWVMGDAITEFERLASRGKESWFGLDLLAQVLDEMVGDFIARIGEKLYVDGNATGTSEDMHGLESWFSVSGLVSNSPVGNPNDSYAGHSTALGVSGSWTAESGWGWPTGTGYEEYCWWSPLEVDYNNTRFSGESANWWYQWQEATNFGLTYLEVLQSTRPDMLIMSPRLFYQAQSSLARYQQLTTSDAELTKLGFRNLQYNGVTMTLEYGVPEAVAYGINFDHLELRNMQSQFIVVHRDNDIRTGEELIALRAYGNLRCDSPAFTLKLAPISSAGT